MPRGVPAKEDAQVAAEYMLGEIGALNFRGGSSRCRFAGCLPSFAIATGGVIGVSGGNAGRDRSEYEELSSVLIWCMVCGMGLSIGLGF